MDMSIELINRYYNLLNFFSLFLHSGQNGPHIKELNLSRIFFNYDFIKNSKERKKMHNI